MFKRVQISILAVAVLSCSLVNASQSNPIIQEDTELLAENDEVPALIDQLLSAHFVNSAAKIEMRSINNPIEPFRWCASVHFGSYMLDWANYPDVEEFFYKFGIVLIQTNCRIKKVDCKEPLNAYINRNALQIEQHESGLPCNLAKEPLGLDQAKKFMMVDKLFDKSFSFAITKTGNIVSIKGHIQNTPIEVNGPSFKEALFLLL